jgi:hypothetical protein
MQEVQIGHVEHCRELTKYRVLCQALSVGLALCVRVKLCLEELNSFCSDPFDVCWLYQGLGKSDANGKLDLLEDIDAHLWRRVFNGRICWKYLLALGLSQLFSRKCHIWRSVREVDVIKGGWRKTFGAIFEMHSLDEQCYWHLCYSEIYSPLLCKYHFSQIIYVGSATRSGVAFPVLAALSSIASKLARKNWQLSSLNPRSNVLLHILCSIIGVPCYSSLLLIEVSQPNKRSRHLNHVRMILFILCLWFILPQYFFFGGGFLW